ncbi:MAG: hypothetical protein NTW06_03080 [Candidatus Falkowbacteria bacterium]|nr:hypothetical protein [Candidatus Falkowbacteria bacterium]
MIPRNCHLWLNQNITANEIDLASVKDYWDHSHVWRYLAKCKECGQLYVHDNVESVDWLAGNDKIFTTIVPVSEAELEEHDFSKLSPTELLKFSPILLLSPDDKLTWINNNVLNN